MKTITFNLKRTPEKVDPNNIYDATQYGSDGVYKITDFTKSAYILFVSKGMVWAVPYNDIKYLMVEEEEKIKLPIEDKKQIGISEELFLKSLAIASGNVEKLKLK